MNYEDIRPYLEAGQTPAEIAASLQADTRHKRDALLLGGDLEKNETDLLHVLAGKLFAYPALMDAYFDAIDLSTADEQTKQIKLGYDSMRVNFTAGNRRPVFANKDAKAGMLVSAITDIVGGLPGMDAATVKAEVDALTGGRLFEGVTEADVQAVIDAKADADRREAIESLRADLDNTVVNPMLSDGVSTAAEVRSAIGAWV